jgi:hypothetical protein
MARKQHGLLLQPRQCDWILQEVPSEKQHQDPQLSKLMETNTQQKRICKNALGLPGKRYNPRICTNTLGLDRGRVRGDGQGTGKKGKKGHKT